MHIYTENGVDYPSVTTILHMISLDDNLMKWANSMGFRRKDLSKLQEGYTSFGTLVHDHLRENIDPTYKVDIPYKDALEKYEVDKVIYNFNNYFTDVKYSTLYTEKTIVSAELGYAGTLDWLTTMSDMKLLLDFKTSKKIRQYMYLQLGGYYNLLRTIGEDVDAAGIIIVNERECSLHPIDKKSLIYYGDLFNLLFKFYTQYTNYKLTPDYDLLTQIKQPIKMINKL